MSVLHDSYENIFPAALNQSRGKKLSHKCAKHDVCHVLKLDCQTFGLSKVFAQQHNNSLNFAQI